MDKGRAQFILRSFRPDGADLHDPDFAEALALAMEDRALGEWLARERAFDATFADALGSLELPADLRRNILGCLAAERGDFPQAEDGHDTALIGALASIQPPPELRAQILAAMDRSAMDTMVVRPVWKRPAVPLAAAAGVALAFFLTREDAPRATVGQSGQLPVDVVQAGFIRTYQSPLFSLDETREDQQSLIANLKSRELPCPCCLPPGLDGVKGIGCRELVIDGKRGSLICFDGNEVGVVHLIIFRREDVGGALPDRDRPDFTQDGCWAAARWQDNQRVFVLIGNTEVSKLATLF